MNKIKLLCVNSVFFATSRVSGLASIFKASSAKFPQGWAPLVKFLGGGGESPPPLILEAYALRSRIICKAIFCYNPNSFQ